MSSHNMPIWVMPTLVTAGLSFSGGATFAAGYSISSITRSSLPKPTMAAWTTTGDGTSSPISCSICSPSMRYGGDSTVRPRTSEYQRVAASTSGTHTAEWANPVSTEVSVGRGEPRRGDEGGAGSCGDGCREERLRGGSGPAGDLVLQPLVPVAEVHPAAPIELAQHNHAHEHQWRQESRECAESDHARPRWSWPLFVSHPQSYTVKSVRTSPFRTRHGDSQAHSEIERPR